MPVVNTTLAPSLRSGDNCGYGSRIALALDNAARCQGLACPGRPPIRFSNSLLSSFRGDAKHRTRNPFRHCCGAMDSGPAPFGASRNDESTRGASFQPRLRVPAGINDPGCAKSHPLPTEGAGNAGRSLRPQPYVRNEKAHKRSHHGHTGIARHSPRNGFNGL